MSEFKLQIEVNNHPYDRDMLYIAIGLKGGFITKDYLVDDEVFSGSYAFYNVLFNYLRIAGMSGLHYDVLRAASIISFSVKGKDLITTLNESLSTLFNYEYNEEIFEIAKLTTREGFANRYKDGAFRAKYKAFEFSDLNKRFLLKSLISDIESIDFKLFRSIVTTLLSPANVCVYICGDTNQIDWNEIQNGIPEVDCKPITVAGYNFDPYLKQDAHIINMAREDANIIVETIDFLNPDVTNFTKLLIVELLAERLPIRDSEVWVDSLDASIIMVSEQLETYKSYIQVFTEDDFDKAKNSLLTKYVVLIEKHPDIFSIKAVNMMLVGVYIDQYLSFLDGCSKDMFSEICAKADLKITEAQIALRKEK